jgi:hypothetical protein
MVPSEWFGHPDHGVFDDHFGLPVDYVGEVAAEITGALELAGINPEDVVFSGYTRSGHKDGGDFDHEVNNISELSQLTKKLYDIEDGYAVGDEMVTRAALVKRLHDLKQGKTSRGKIYTYCFGEPSTLTDLSYNGRDNPLYYAGLSEPVIGVYDKTRLQVLATKDDITYDAVWVVDLTEADLRSALLVEYYPRFEIEGY